MIVPKEGKVSKFIEQRLNSVKISFISKVTVDSKKLMEKYSEVFAHFNEQIASEDPILREIDAELENTLVEEPAQEEDVAEEDDTPDAGEDEE